MDQNDGVCQRDPENAKDIKKVPDFQNIGSTLLDQKNPFLLSQTAREKFIATLDAVRCNSAATTYTNKTKLDTAIVNGLASIPIIT